MTEECQYQNQLASDWMHRGIDLLNENSTDKLGQAIRCFDEAIALRRALPLETEPFLRYGLSAGWINRGDAMTRLGDAAALAGAVESYDAALALLESLSLEDNILYPRRLAITWINRGAALQKQETANSLWEAVECFREAIAVLDHPSAAAVKDRISMQAGAWANLAAVFEYSSENTLEEALAAARTALAMAKPMERTDAIAAETALRARHAFCRTAVKSMVEGRTLGSDLIAEAVNTVDEAMSVAAHWKLQGHANPERLARDIFRLGCRIYERDKPHFLAEFLLKGLDPEQCGFSLDSEALAAAQRAIWSALDDLQVNGFRFVATPDFDSFMADVRRLREVEERLQQLVAPPLASLGTTNH